MPTYGERREAVEPAAKAAPVGPPAARDDAHRHLHEIQPAERVDAPEPVFVRGGIGHVRLRKDKCGSGFLCPRVECPFRSWDCSLIHKFDSAVCGFGFLRPCTEY